MQYNGEEKVRIAVKIWTSYFEQSLMAWKIIKNENVSIFFVYLLRIFYEELLFSNLIRLFNEIKEI